jgi:hypothetical protein
MRGLVITPTITITEVPGGTEFSASIDPTYLRQCALYWDLIELPDFILGGGFGENDPDLDLLQSEKILRRTRGHLVKKEEGQYKLSFWGEHPREFWSIAQFYAFVKHQQSGDIWRMGRMGSGFDDIPSNITDFYFIEPQGDSAGALRLPLKPLPAAKSLSSSQLRIVEGNIIELELYQVLPVPSSDVPLDEVLQFKLKRQDELTRFRHAMDKLILELGKAEDKVRALEYGKAELEIALADLHRLLDETKIKEDNSNRVN